MNVVCIDGPNRGETHSVRDDTRDGDIVFIRQPVAPITVEECQTEWIINPLQSEEAWQRAAKRMTQPIEQYLFIDGTLKHISKMAFSDV